MPKFRVPAYRLHKPSGRGIVSIDGKVVYLPGAYGSDESQAAYRRALRDKLHSDIVDLPVRYAESLAQHGNPSLRNLLAAFQLHAEETYRDAETGKLTPEVAHLKVVIDVMNSVAGERPAREFGPLKLQRCQAEFVNHGYTRKTVNDYTNRCRRVFKWAVANEILPGSVLHALQAVDGLRWGRTKAPEGRVVHGVEEQRMRKVLPHLSKQLAVVVELLFLTGARPSEILRMKPSEIDRDGIEVENDQRCWVFRPTKHKGSWRGLDRTILLGKRSQELLGPFLERDPGAYCFSPAEAEGERMAARRAQRKSKRWESHVRHQATKKAKRKPRVLRDHYEPGALRRAVKRACEKAKVTHWFPYQLRHSAGTRLARQYGAETAGEVLGHCDTRTTARYVDPNTKAVAQAMFGAG